jgi:D-alanyl-D-alanine carboxypeptidase
VGRAALACVVLLALIGCGAKAEPPDPGPRLTGAVARRLDSELRQKVQDTGVPGAAAAIVFADGRMWSGAAGAAVLKPRREMTAGTALPFDSVTKVASATLALRLAEQGKLDLDDPIRRWYPAWRGAARATVRDLLGHTSGLADPPDRFWEAVLDHPRRPVSVRDFIAATPKPGPRTTSAEYSNAGFLIAGLILERAAHEPVAAAMRREVFNHAGGDGLAMQPDERPAPPLAHSYWYPHGVGTPVDASDGGPVLPSRVSAGMVWTAGALAGDVASLARWGHELLGGRILEPSSLREMTRFHHGTFWDGYGLGLARYSFADHIMWGHSGDGLGSHTEFWHLPTQRLTIAVTWNDDAIDMDGGIMQGLLRAALNEQA